VRELQQEIAAFDALWFTSLGPGYLALNLAAEAGELADVFKKLWRADPRVGEAQGFAQVPEEMRRAAAEELADVAIVGLVFANHLGIDLEAEVRSKLVVIEQRLRAGYYGHEAKG
jgi:NTP pyrophosphatase (non-canonical NTP hydrolase)